MASSTDDEDSLAKTVRQAAQRLRGVQEATQRGRDAIALFSQALADCIKNLPTEEIAQLGLEVKLVTRGAPLPAEYSGVIRETLPSVDDEKFDARPGATALYLQALGDGRDRQYYEIRLSPGDGILVDSSFEERNSDGTEAKENWTTWLRGIGIFDNQARLVSCNERLNQQPVLQDTATSFLRRFLNELYTLLGRKLRSNYADRM